MCTALQGDDECGAYPFSTFHSYVAAQRFHLGFGHVEAQPFALMLRVKTVVEPK